jgi:hypothetical protein
MRYAPVLQWHKQIRVLHCTKARVLCCWSDLFGYVNYFTAFFLRINYFTVFAAGVYSTATLYSTNHCGCLSSNFWHTWIHWVCETQALNSYNL